LRTRENPLEWEAARRQPEEPVARGHALGAPDPGALDDADGEARQVVLARRVGVGHLRRLPPSSAAAGLLAAPGDPPEHRLGLVDVEAPGGEVVEEEERPGARGEDVVDAHGHEIDAHGVVAVGGEGHAELRPDPVGARDQDRIGQSLGDPTETGETAETVEDLGDPGAGSQGLDAIHQRVARGDAHARVVVGPAHVAVIAGAAKGAGRRGVVRLQATCGGG
jgi:hypothetical protein